MKYLSWGILFSGFFLWVGVYNIQAASMMDVNRSFIGPQHRVWTVIGGPSSHQNDCYRQHLRTCTGMSAKKIKSGSESGMAKEKTDMSKPEEALLIKLQKVPYARIVEQENGNLLVRFNKMVFFDNATARISDDARKTLNQLATVMQRNRNFNITIQGHTNNIPIKTPKFADNQALSEARAEAVREYLVERSVYPKRLRAVGYGEARPIVPNDTNKNRKKNRRVDFLFEVKQ